MFYPLFMVCPATVLNASPSPMCRADMWAAQQKTADEDRGWNSCDSGIPPMGRCHILAQQIQGKCFPLRGQSDLHLLGPDSRSLLPSWVGCEIISATAAAAEEVIELGVIGAFLFQLSEQTAALLRHPGEKCTEWERTSCGANIWSGAHLRSWRVRQHRGKFQQWYRWGYIFIFQHIKKKTQNTTLPCLSSQFIVCVGPI